jgi:hypothetical protein
MSLLSATLAEPQSFATWEKLLLLVLILASAALFFRRFGPILDRILKSKKDPNFSLSPIGKRIWDFFWEVLCQAKVIRERPLPGLAHAFVFWGFCAFALVTLNHFAVGFGLGFLDPAGFFGRTSPQPSPPPAPSASPDSSSAASSFAPAGSDRKSPTNPALSPPSSSSSWLPTSPLSR